MNFPRESGILLHITSLPGRYGMGDLGPGARAFADTLVDMGQHLWQILPHGLTGYGDSPYQSFSTFAGNPLFISFDMLVEDGLLHQWHLGRFPKFPEDHVDYGAVIPARTAILRTVCRTFERHASQAQKQAFTEFCERNKDWLEDFALFMALKEAHNLEPWHTWEPELVRREPSALAHARKHYRTAIRNAKILQWIFDDQWHRFRLYCRDRGIKIIGDIPIFVAHDSADAWAHPELFYIEPDGRCSVVAGVPPDYFSATGQLWGNPLYRWDVHKAQDYAWWAARLRKIFQMVDIVRIDHFRGFAACWEIPAGEATAVNGRWMPGPGERLFKAVARALGPMPIIAEDLGVITPDVDALRRRFAFPGMRILQFAFSGNPQDRYLPHNHEPDSVVYTGTHDNNTVAGWWAEAGDAERHFARGYLATDGHDMPWTMIRAACMSVADTCIVPMQDVLGLPGDCRMNLPGQGSGWWRWRLQWSQVHPWHAQRLAELCRLYGRSG